MTVVVIGASSGLGRALAARFARAGDPLVLVSSDRRDLDAHVADFGLNGGAHAVAVALDLADRELSLAALDAALDSLPAISALLLAAGFSSDDDVPGQDSLAFENITRINYLSLCRIVEHCLPRLPRAGRAAIIGFGSVAATRGRSRNVAYAAAKRALDSYFESLRHSLAAGGVIAQFYVLGYLDTNLSFGRRTLLPKIAPSRVADIVFRNRERDFGRSYVPWFWRPVCWAVRALPWFVFRKLSF